MPLDRLQIVVFALFPGWAWALLIGGAWSLLVFLALGRLKFRDGRMLGLLAVVTLRALVAVSIVIATSVDPIERFPCLAGIFGIPLTPLFIAIEAGLLYAVSKRWPRTATGRKDRFGVWLAVWLVFGAIALGAHFRSAMLCTV